MKTLLCLALLSVAAKATVVYIDSEAANTTNNSGHPTVGLTGQLLPNPGWATALPDSDWISFGATGDHSDRGYFSPPDGTVVTFTTRFTLAGAITGASLDVLADDSTSVILNGHQLIAADLKPGTRCASAPIGCLTSTEGVFTFAELSPYLVDGTNTLSFGVVQVAGSSFGLDFAGMVDDGPQTQTETPETATIAFIGGGLVVLALLRRRK
jgi:hypothetical protein